MRPPSIYHCKITRVQSFEEENGYPRQWRTLGSLLHWPRWYRGRFLYGVHQKLERWMDRFQMYQKLARYLDRKSPLLSIPITTVSLSKKEKWSLGWESTLCTTPVSQVWLLLRQAAKPAILVTPWPAKVCGSRFLMSNFFNPWPKIVIFFTESLGKLFQIPVSWGLGVGFMSYLSPGISCTLGLDPQSP